MSRILGALAIAVILAGCVPTEPEFTEEEQIPAEEREAAEAPEGEAPAEGEVLTFVAVDIDYSDAPGSAPAGEHTVEIVNEGEILHNVVFEGIAGDEPIAEAQGGETEQGTAALDAGTVVYYCSVPGHREAGMEGELTVE